MYHTNTTDNSITNTNTSDPLSKLFTDLQFMTGDFLTTLLTETTGAELRVYWACRWFANRGNKDTCFAKAQRIVDKTGLHIDTVRRARASLCRKGYMRYTGIQVWGVKKYILTTPPTPPPDTTSTIQNTPEEHVRNLSEQDPTVMPSMVDPTVMPSMADPTVDHISLGTPYHLSTEGKSLLRVYDSDIKKKIKGGLKKKGGIHKEIRTRVERFLLKAGYDEKEAKRLALNTVDQNTGNDWTDTRTGNPIVCRVSACVALAHIWHDTDTPPPKQRTVVDTSTPPIPEDETATGAQVQELMDKFKSS